MRKEPSGWIHKEDFSSMHVLGQFNLGFIITRRVKLYEGEEGHIVDDLFIVDQHAADEKFNFETLQQTTKIESQKLFQPRRLELTAADELVAMENLDVLRSNGFEVVIDDDAPVGHGERVKLVAQPVSKGTTFTVKGMKKLHTSSVKRFNRYILTRLRRAPALNARSAKRSNGAVLESTSHVCNASMSEKCHGWDASDHWPDDIGD